MRQAIRVRAMREDRGRFAALRNERVLIYWPHGLGDWVHFGGIAPKLEPSNMYAITRFGDDYVSVMEGNSHVQPLFSGTRAPSSGKEVAGLHFGLRLKQCSGRYTALDLPPPMNDAVTGFSPGVLLWTDYPETEGWSAYPFHTKARNLIRLLVRKERLATLELAQPLRNSIDFTAPAELQGIVDERLRSLVPPGTRLCVISRSGVTAARKNWGDGREVREFVEAMQRDRVPWRFISMDGDDFGSGSTSFRALFGEIDEPFARLYKAVAARIDLFVGIPAGPLHFVLARGGVPTVGLWLSHHPDWYDEPNPAAIHLVGRYVRDRGFDRRPATVTKPDAMRHRLHYLDSHSIGAAAVLDAAREVMT
jgi:hypothetical protein